MPHSRSVSGRRLSRGLPLAMSRSKKSPSTNSPAFYCRLGEALLHQGRQRGRRRMRPPRLRSAAAKKKRSPIRAPGYSAIADGTKRPPRPMSGCWSSVRNGPRGIATRAAPSPPQAKWTARSFTPRRPASAIPASVEFACHAGCLLALCRAAIDERGRVFRARRRRRARRAARRCAICRPPNSPSRARRGGGARTARPVAGAR